MITSIGNPQVRELIQLQKKPKLRAAQDVFLVEGEKMYREIPKARLVRTYLSESYYNKRKIAVHGRILPMEAQFPGEVAVLSDQVFEKVSDTRTPQGILGVVRQFHYTLSDLLGGGKWGNEASGAGMPLLLALENLQDPGNLGTVLRAAEGAGATGILMSEGCVDIYNPKVIRSTMGSVFRVPFCYSQSWEGDLRKLKRLGVRLFAAHLKGENLYGGSNFTVPACILIGNESQGLSENTAALADRCLWIPMQGSVESLNAAVSASLLLYEAYRQRAAAAAVDLPC